MEPAATTRAPALLPRSVLAAAGALFVLQCWAFHDVRRDDAFITFRYAQNLATGHGLVFNPGERLMGSTSPGHVWLSALVYPIAGRDLLPSVMSCLGCLGWTAQILALIVLLRRVLSPWATGLVALAVAAGAARSCEFVSLETNLVAALLLWTFVMVVERRWSWAAALGALAGLFRPDMYLPALLVAGLCVYELRARAWRPGLLFAAISAPWYLFALTYFGKVLPQSAAAKYQRTDALEYAVFVFKLPASMALPWIEGAWLHLLAWLLAVAGGVLLIRTPRLWIVPVFAVLHYAAYLYLRPYMHHWHIYPANLVFVVLVLVAVVSAFGFAARSPLARRAGLAAAALLCVGYVQYGLHFQRTHGDAFWFGARDQVYREIARYLRAHADPDDVVASVEVGTVGYYSGLRMYDWGAIITPDPEYRPRKPRLSWSVVDHLFTDRFAVGLVSTREFKVGEFAVSVHSFDLMRAAMLRVARHPLAAGAPLPREQRGEFERELAALSAGLERSGQTVDAFLAGQAGAR